MAGRPKLTEEATLKIVTLIKNGAYRNVACAEVGITDQTLRNWERRGRDPKAPKLFRDFVHKLAAAEAAWENREVRGISKAGEWRARAWLLERKVPERWSRPDDQLPDAQEDDELDMSALAPEERVQFRRMLQKMTRARQNGPKDDDDGEAA